ncbi:MAG: acyl carrier protein [Clostridia bacterium]|nr:acyl carrier protein [Clostridia bacterium]
MEQLMKILEQTCPGVDFNSETALIDDEILESLDLVTIVSEIIDVFDVEITVDDLIPENFNSAKDIMALIESRRG